MSCFAAVLVRRAGRWHGSEVATVGCESLTDLADLLRDFSGDVRLLCLEEDDEYAALIRLDDDADEPHAFLSDGHAADSYANARVVAEDLEEIGGDELKDDPLADDTPVAVVHDSAPFGDPDVVDDLGTSAADLLAMCAHQGTLPVDLLLAVCEKAGCGEVFEDLRG
jgi:putative tRNA adenosine deaminase-associated protein